MAKTTLPNKHEVDWKTYRNYRWRSFLTGLQVVESSRCIRFQQRNTYDLKRLGIAIGCLILVNSFIFAFAHANSSQNPSIILIAFTLLLVVAAFVVAVLFVWTHTVLDVLADRLIIDRKARGSVTIPLEELRSIEVRSERGSDSSEETHALHIWHGPIPIRVFAFTSAPEAIAHREGMVAAIGLMSAASVAPAATVNHTRRRFVE